MSRISIGKNVKQDLDTKMKVNPPNNVLKRIRNPLAISVARYVIHQTNVGVMGKENSIENATIAIIMDIRLMNAKRNQNLKANVTNAKNMYTSHQNAKPRY